MHHVPGADRDAPINASLNQLVGATSFVRIIDAFVDVIDLESFGFAYFQLKEQGRPPYHPSFLMKLYLYGYRKGIRSCRALEEACRTNVEVMWLMEQRVPSYKTINNFRKENVVAFRAVFRRFVYLLKEWKLVQGKTIAIDSFKIRAQNSLKNNYNASKIERHLKYIDGKIAAYEAELCEEEDVGERVELEIKILDQKDKRKSYRGLQKKLEASAQEQLSTTDPDARAVVFQRNSVRVGYNIQAASDAKHKLLIAMDTGDVNDTQALSPMVKQVATNIDQARFDVLADKGYHSGRELAWCEAQKIKTFVSPKASSSNKSGKHYPVTQFRYTPRTDTYTCPAGQILRSNGKYYCKRQKGRKSYSVKHYKTRACKSCALRSQCTQNKNGRVIERSEYQASIRGNNRRVAQKPDYYRQRQELIEHQFGTLKRQRHFDYVLLRGKEKVLGEVSLSFIAYNLTRVVSILGFEAVLRRLKAFLGHFFVLFWLSALLSAEVIRFNFATGRSHHLPGHE